MADLNQSQVAKLFEYDGVDLIRKIRCKKGLPGPCKSRCVQGYYRVQVDGIGYKVHRLIWILVNGAIPHGMFIDHINGLRTDNRIENLRLVTPNQNQFNRKKAYRGTSKYKGVSKSSKDGRFDVIIQKNYRSVRVGMFDTEVEAAMAYNQKAKELFGEHAKLNEVSCV